MESHSENTRSHSSVTCYRILRKDYSYIHLDSWDPTHTFINTDQSEVREKVRVEPITETEQGWLPMNHLHLISYVSSAFSQASHQPALQRHQSKWRYDSSIRCSPAIFSGNSTQTYGGWGPHSNQASMHVVTMKMGVTWPVLANQRSVLRPIRGPNPSALPDQRNHRKLTGRFQLNGWRDTSERHEKESLQSKSASPSAKSRLSQILCLQPTMAILIINLR